MNESKDTNAQTPSNIIKGMQFKSMDAKQAIEAPIKFRSIKTKFLLVTLPNSVKI